MATTVLASVGDHGALNAALPTELQSVWIDRDLGWLDFNERVLAEALDERTPLLERAKFLAIVSSNLDEFFMKRIAPLTRKLAGQPAATTLEQTPSPQLQALRDRILALTAAEARAYTQAIRPELARQGV